MNSAFRYTEATQLNRYLSQQHRQSGSKTRQAIIDRYAKLIPSMSFTDQFAQSWIKPHKYMEPSKIHVMPFEASRLTPNFKASSLAKQNELLMQSFLPSMNEPVTPFRAKNQRQTLFRGKKFVEIPVLEDKEEECNKTDPNPLFSILSTPIIRRKNTSSIQNKVAAAVSDATESSQCHTPQSILKIKRLIQIDEEANSPQLLSQRNENEEIPKRNDSRMSRESTPGKSLRFNVPKKLPPTVDFVEEEDANEEPSIGDITPATIDESKSESSSDLEILDDVEMKFEESVANESVVEASSESGNEYTNQEEEVESMDSEAKDDSGEQSGMLHLTDDEVDVEEDVEGSNDEEAVEEEEEQEEEKEGSHCENVEKEDDESDENHSDIKNDYPDQTVAMTPTTMQKFISGLVTPKHPHSIDEEDDKSESTEMTFNFRTPVDKTPCMSESEQKKFVASLVAQATPATYHFANPDIVSPITKQKEVEDSSGLEIQEDVEIEFEESAVNVKESDKNQEEEVKPMDSEATAYAGEESESTEITFNFTTPVDKTPCMTESEQEKVAASTSSTYLFANPDIVSPMTKETEVEDSGKPAQKRQLPEASNLVTIPEEPTDSAEAEGSDSEEAMEEDDEEKGSHHENVEIKDDESENVEITDDESDENLTDTKTDHPDQTVAMTPKTMQNFISGLVSPKYLQPIDEDTGKSESTEMTFNLRNPVDKAPCISESDLATPATCPSTIADISSAMSKQPEEEDSVQPAQKCQLSKASDLAAIPEEPTETHKLSPENTGQKSSSEDAKVSDNEEALEEHKDQGDEEEGYHQGSVEKKDDGSEANKASNLTAIPEEPSTETHKPSPRKRGRKSSSATSVMQRTTTDSASATRKSRRISKASDNESEQTEVTQSIIPSPKKRGRKSTSATPIIQRTTLDSASAPRRSRRISKASDNEPEQPEVKPLVTPSPKKRGRKSTSATSVMQRTTLDSASAPRRSRRISKQSDNESEQPELKPLVTESIIPSPKKRGRKSTSATSVMQRTTLDAVPTPRRSRRISKASDNEPEQPLKPSPKKRGRKSTSATTVIQETNTLKRGQLKLESEAAKATPKMASVAEKQSGKSPKLRSTNM